MPEPPATPTKPKTRNAEVLMGKPPAIRHRRQAKGDAVLIPASPAAEPPAVKQSTAKTTSASAQEIAQCSSMLVRSSASWRQERSSMSQQIIYGMMKNNAPKRLKNLVILLAHVYSMLFWKPSLFDAQRCPTFPRHRHKHPRRSHNEWRGRLLWSGQHRRMAQPERD